MQAVLKRFRCWRHSRGFGIHSPFAFRFVTEVLCQPLHYYAYSDIPADRSLRLLLRLVLSFRPRRVCVMSAQSDILGRAVRAASSAVVLADSSPDMLVVDVATTPPDRYLPLLSPGVHAVFFKASPADVDAILSARQAGMTFSNRRGTLVVASYTHIPRQDFDVRF